MIGESTPRNVGVLNGQQSWDQWFAPFFSFIHTHPEVKEFSYIDWNWSQYPQWSTWGDARLEQNAIVGGDFANEMDSLQYLHASTERAFRKTFGLSDTIAPPIPGTISVVQSGFPLRLNWDAVTDQSGLSHYIIYKNGVLSDYTLTLPYADNKIKTGDTLIYAVSAMDRAGNESQPVCGLSFHRLLTRRSTENSTEGPGTGISPHTQLVHLRQCKLIRARSFRDVIHVWLRYLKLPEQTGISNCGSRSPFIRNGNIK